MKEEIKQVLDMLKEGKITNEEAVNLIDALKSTEEDQDQRQITTGKQKRFLKVNVTRNNQPKVNVKIPFSLVKWGINIANKMGKDTVKIGGEDIPFDKSEAPLSVWFVIQPNFAVFTFIRFVCPAVDPIIISAFQHFQYFGKPRNSPQLGLLIQPFSFLRPQEF